MNRRIFLTTVGNAAALTAAPPLAAESEVKRRTTSKMYPEK